MVVVGGSHQSTSRMISLTAGFVLLVFYLVCVSHLLLIHSLRMKRGQSIAGFAGQC